MPPPPKLLQAAPAALAVPAAAALPKIASVAPVVASPPVPVLGQFASRVSRSKAIAFADAAIAKMKGAWPANVAFPMPPPGNPALQTETVRTPSASQEFEGSSVGYSPTHTPASERSESESSEAPWNVGRKLIPTVIVDPDEQRRRAGESQIDRGPQDDRCSSDGEYSPVHPPGFWGWSETDIAKDVEEFEEVTPAEWEAWYETAQARTVENLIEADLIAKAAGPAASTGSCVSCT